MRWNSVEEIIKHFKLENKNGDLKLIRGELLKLLAEFHPDKEGGKFKSDYHKEQYALIQDSIDFIDRQIQNNSSLVPINQVTEIIKQVTESIIGKEKKDINKKVNELKVEYRKEVKKSYSQLKISSGSTAGICAGLLAFSNYLAQNETFNFIFKIPFFTYLLAFIMVLSGFWYIIALLKEKKDSEKQEWLFSEDGKLYFLTRIVWKYQFHRTENPEEIIFSFSNYVSIIRSYFFQDYKYTISKKKGILGQVRYFAKKSFFELKRLKIRLQKHYKLSQNIAEQIAQIHLEEFEKRGILKRYSGKSIEIFYIVETEYIGEIKSKYYEYERD